MHLGSLILLLVSFPGCARRSIRLVDSRHGTKQQNSTVGSSLEEVSVEARDVLIPGGFGGGFFRRAGPQAGALHGESQRVAPWFRFGRDRAKVALQAGGPKADRPQSKEATATEKQVLVPIAEGSEEIETACITDVLTRAGAKVTVASVMPALQVEMSRGLNIVADCNIAECIGKEWDAVVCPGGMPGAEHLRNSEALKDILLTQSEKEKVTAAICASPAVVFQTHGLLTGKATCYPNDNFKGIVGSNFQDEKVVQNGHIITSQGPGTSLQFALKIVEALYGEAKAAELGAALLTTSCMGSGAPHNAPEGEEIPSMGEEIQSAGRVVTELVDATTPDGQGALPERFSLAVRALRGDFSVVDPSLDTERAEDSFLRAFTTWPTSVTLRIVSRPLEDGQAENLLRDLRTLGDGSSVEVKMTSRGARCAIDLRLHGVPDATTLSVLRNAIKADDRVQMVF